MENYALALCRLLRKMGREVALYQWAHYEEWRSYEGIPVVVREIKGRSTFEMTAEMERWAGPEIIYVWLGTQLQYRPGNITISHGIWWDYDNAGPGRVDEVKKYILAALEGCPAIVSVDTNFLNWVRASLPGHAGNIVYVPNFLDTARFRPEEPAGAALRPATGRTEVSRAVLLYPRRVSAERGTATMMGLASRFLEAYPGVEVVFAGVGNRQSQEYRDFLNWLSGHPHRDRIRHIAAGPEEMPGIYRQADSVVMPSPCCEGTSLSQTPAALPGHRLESAEHSVRARGKVMRVLIPLSQFFPGGQTTHVLRLAKYLRRSGHEVTVLHTRPSGRSQVMVTHYRRALALDGVEVLTAAKDGPSAALDPFRWDLIHAHSAIDWPLAQARDNGCPYVLTVHGLGCDRSRFIPILQGASQVIAVGRIEPERRSGRPGLSVGSPFPLGVPQ